MQFLKLTLASGLAGTHYADDLPAPLAPAAHGVVLVKVGPVAGKQRRASRLP